jgi:hypothetical protein
MGESEEFKLIIFLHTGEIATVKGNLDTIRPSLRVAKIGKHRLLKNFSGDSLRPIRTGSLFLVAENATMGATLVRNKDGNNQLHAIFPISIQHSTIRWLSMPLFFTES